MAKSPTPSSDSVAYPKGGTFAQLLAWHLDWGTRPGSSTEAPNEQWVRSHFAQLVHDEGLALDSATRSLRNWTNRGKLPEEHNQTKWNRICRELFGDDPNLQGWKADLHDALRQGRSHAEPRRRVKGDTTNNYERTLKLWDMLVNLYKLTEFACQKAFELPATEFMDDDEKDEFLKRFNEADANWIKAFGKPVLEKIFRRESMKRAREAYDEFRLYHDPIRVIWDSEFNGKIFAIFPIILRMFEKEKLGHVLDESLFSDVQDLRIAMRDAEITVAAELKKLRA